MVRPARRVGEREVRRLLPALGRAADRRRHGAPAAPDRAEPRARHDPDRPRGRRARGLRLGPGQPAGAGRAGACRGEGAGRGDREVSAGLHALRPPLVLRAVEPRAAGRARQRRPARPAGVGRRRRKRARRASPPARAAAEISAISDGVLADRGDVAHYHAEGSPAARRLPADWIDVARGGADDLAVAGPMVAPRSTAGAPGRFFDDSSLAAPPGTREFVDDRWPQIAARRMGSARPPTIPIIGS